MRLKDKRILITLAVEFMGPVLCEVMAAYGAVVLGDPRCHGWRNRSGKNTSVTCSA